MCHFLKQEENFHHPHTYYPNNVRYIKVIDVDRLTNLAESLARENGESGYHHLTVHIHFCSTVGSKLNRFTLRKGNWSFGAYFMIHKIKVSTNFKNTAPTISVTSMIFRGHLSVGFK